MCVHSLLAPRGRPAPPSAANGRGRGHVSGARHVGGGLLRRWSLGRREEGRTCRLPWRTQLGVAGTREAIQQGPGLLF